MASASGPCPVRESHTLSPQGYVAWHNWAEQKAKTHRQVKCKGCDRYAIWIPRLGRRP
jgi:hypothetical protein